MYFKGDVIITDPCYVVKDQEIEINYDTEPKAEDFGLIEYPTRLDFPNREDHRQACLKVMAHNKVLLPAYDAAYAEWQKQYEDDWAKSECGSNMEALGVNTYLTSDTLYGDWSCTTVNTDTKEEIGSFCADAGLVSVFLLDEILAYNPEFDYHINRQWTTTLIKDFDGEIEIVEDDFGNGKIEVRVIGKGNINFYTTQTGF